MQLLLHLIETGKLTAAQFVELCAAQAERQETVGSIALRTNMLTIRQVSQILRVQSLEDARFGDIAVRMGFLTRQKLTTLLRLQQDYRPSLRDLAVEFGYVRVDALEAAQADLRRIHREREMEAMKASLSSWLGHAPEDAELPDALAATDHTSSTSAPNISLAAENRTRTEL